MGKGKSAVENNEGINKIGLAHFVADETGMTHSDATRLVESIFEKMTETLKSGGVVRVAGFGSFRVQTYAPRLGRNPRNGSQVKVPSVRRPRFIPSKGLKEEVNHVATE